MPSMANTHFSNRNRHSIETTMIQGTNFNIGYAKLKMANQQINEVAVERRYALDLLRANCSLGALVDANARYDPPRCAEATRHGILQKMGNWVLHDGPRDDAQSSIFWLYGGAGAGKSALAQTLAEKFKINDLAASFFFFKADANRNDGNRLIPTLALQLLQSFPEITPFVEEKILANPDLFKKNRLTQMFELLVEPLKRLSVKETDGEQSNTERKLHPRLVVIDGLDECIGTETQCDLLRIIASVIPHLPYPLRFLITSRPEAHITRVFQHDLKSVARYNLSDDSDADKDIRNFLEEEFANIHLTHPLRQHLPPQWPPRGSISSIVGRSSGHFMYPTTVMRFIQCPQHRPDDRLQIVLGLKEPYELERPFARLDSLYSLIFHEIKDPGQLEKIHCALGIMHLRSLKNGLFAWWQQNSDRRVIESLLDLRPGDLVLLFGPLLSLVTFDNDDIRILHKSLFDYLLDPNRSEGLALDLGLAHEIAADHILSVITLGISWDSIQFQLFAYHCQFARLNDTLRGHLRSLASTFTESFSRSFGSSTRSSVLQSIIYFLQSIGRQDFDSSGDCYRQYVEMKNQWLKSVVPLSQRLKCMISRLRAFRKSAYFERNLRLSFNGFSVLKDPQRRSTNEVNGRGPIPCLNMSVIKSIKPEHEMFSSYVKAHHQYPNIVVSFLEPCAELIHSCHFVIRAVSGEMWVTFVMVVTYTQSGERLSCSEFKGLISLREHETIMCLVEEHRRRTRNELGENVTVIYTTSIARLISSKHAHFKRERR